MKTKEIRSESRRLRWVGRALLVLLLALLAVIGTLLPPAFLCARVAGENTVIRFDPARKSLSVTAEGVAIADFAKRFAGETGVSVLLDKTIQGEISVAFENLPLEEAVRRVFGSNNSALFYTREIADDGRAIFHLDRVKLFAGGNATTADYTVIAKAADAPATSSGDGTVMTRADWAKLEIERLERRKSAHMANIRRSAVTAKAELTGELSPEERFSRLRDLSQKKMELAQVRQTYDEAIEREERIVQMQAGASGMTEGRRKLFERMTKSRDQREMPPPAGIPSGTSENQKGGDM